MWSDIAGCPGGERIICCEIGIVQEAAGVATVADLVFGGHDGWAGFEDVGTTRVKAAARWGIAQIGGLAGHGRWRDGVVQARERGQQETGIRMAWFDQHSIGWTEFDMLTGVGDGNGVAEIAGETDIVGDESWRSRGLP